MVRAHPTVPMKSMACAKFRALAARAGYHPATTRERSTAVAKSVGEICRRIIRASQYRSVDGPRAPKPQLRDGTTAGSHVSGLHPDQAISCSSRLEPLVGA